MKQSLSNLIRKFALSEFMIAALVLSSAGCGKKPPMQMPPPEVSFVTAKAEDVTLMTELPGRVAPFLIAEVRPQVGGIIQKRLFEEGSDVKEGDVLYQIDDSIYKASYEKAKADLARAEASMLSIKKNYNRSKKLIQTEAVSQKDYDDAEANLKAGEADILACKAALESAKINLDYAKITAPISGHIGRSLITVGALVTPNNQTALTTIQKIDPVYVDVTESNASLLRLKDEIAKGRLNYTDKERTEVKLLLENKTLYPQLGSLQFRDITIDPSTGSFVLRIVFPNPDRTLLPGMFVQARLQLGVNKNAILIPQQAISRDTKGRPLTLLVGPDNKIMPKMLEIGQTVGDKWLVTEGLKPGDRIVVEGLQKIRPGSLVRPVPFAPAQAPADKQTTPGTPAAAAK